MPTVLIADDAEFMRLMLRHILTRAGYEIVGEAGSGDAALACYRALRPDVMLLDLTLPVSEGQSALEQVRAVDPGGSVVVCSSAGQEAAAAASIVAGAREYVVKPFRPAAVLAAVERALGTPRLTSDAA